MDAFVYRGKVQGAKAPHGESDAGHARAIDPRILPQEVERPSVGVQQVARHGLTGEEQGKGHLPLELWYQAMVCLLYTSRCV